MKIGLWVLAAVLIVELPGQTQSASSPDPLNVLTSGFENQTSDVQQKILRHVGLLQSEESIPFLASVALTESFGQEVRREALKAFLALRSPERFRPVLRPLSSTLLELTSIIDAFLEIDDRQLVAPFVQAAVQPEIDERIQRKMILAVLSLWSERESSHENFELWRKTKASEILAEVAKNSTGARQSRALLVLGRIHDEASTKALIRFLDSDDHAIVASAIKGLARGGEKGAPALGRFLQKSKSPELRRFAVEALGRIGGAASVRALESYRSRAEPSEKGLVSEMLARLKKKNR
ncbi:MAG TPA: HEAT repeat domain-containing protein [Bdellovibrionota bacterium]|nr:HEAT repeat domain-containing protein [Bdellovibrionota bacterium]